MKSEDAREILKAWSTDDYPLGLIYEALDVAIKALEQTELKPRCNSVKIELDTISRQAAIDAAKRTDYRGLTVEDVTKVTDEVVKELAKLPSVSTEKTGRWIESNGVGMFVCSFCNESFYPMPTCMGKPLMKYCPNCGAKMEVEE